MTKVSVQTHCNALQHTATHCYTRQHTAIHCTLQHTATHCNTLQHTATHYMIQSCVRSRCGKQCVAVCCSVLLCTVTTLCCNVLQCVAVCCSDDDDESEPSLLALALALVRALFLFLSLKRTTSLLRRPMKTMKMVTKVSTDARALSLFRAHACSLSLCPLFCTMPQSSLSKAIQISRHRF